ncbi:hypothetical protein [Pseudomonas schmalbachii]|uniref:Uncharacterized protein n=1 Tax=Pseudomonas schmalbachii TaxID=2816993 RepID=A0ABS3TMH1_9PSED|nr:hypothetical protein [Pseudomonas schmalbachii]MBO3274847.1 hypothetical protein [Pseudomonas schmalbachii]
MPVIDAGLMALRHFIAVHANCNVAKSSFKFLAEIQPIHPPKQIFICWAERFIATCNCEMQIMALRLQWPMDYRTDSFSGCFRPDPAFGGRENFLRHAAAGGRAVVISLLFVWTFSRSAACRTEAIGEEKAAGDPP